MSAKLFIDQAIMKARFNLKNIRAQQNNDKNTPKNDNFSVSFFIFILVSLSTNNLVGSTINKHDLTSLSKDAKTA